MNDDFSNTDYFHNTFEGENLNKNIPHTIKQKMNKPDANNTVFLLTMLPVLLGSIISCGIAIKHTEEKTNLTLEHIQKERFTVNKFTVDGPSTTVERSQTCNPLVAQIVDPAHPLHKLPGNNYKNIPKTYQRVSGYLNNNITPQILYINREKEFDTHNTVYIENYSPTYNNDSNNQSECKIGH